ncbi:Prefoldin subunit alpha [uncultured archaeon]|nr:Prefoldin subunit alpha [uncultured archaeon]
MANEEELNRLAAELQVQQSNGEAIRQQIQAMQSSLLEIGAAMNAVQNLKKVKGDTLVPLGAGVFLSCPKPDPERVVINIGANVMVQKKPEEAVKLLEERQKAIRDAISSAQQDLEQAVSAIDEIKKRANSIAAEEGRNVRPPKE